MSDERCLGVFGRGGHSGREQRGCRGVGCADGGFDCEGVSKGYEGRTRRGRIRKGSKPNRNEGRAPPGAPAPVPRSPMARRAGGARAHRTPVRAAAARHVPRRASRPRPSAYDIEISAVRRGFSCIAFCTDRLLTYQDTSLDTDLGALSGCARKETTVGALSPRAAQLSQGSVRGCPAGCPRQSTEAWRWH